MRIGLDIDGVIFNTEECYKIAADIYNLRIKAKILDKKEIRVQKKFDWSKKQFNEFLEEYHVQIMKEAPLNSFANQVLKILQEQGNEFFVISSRVENEVAITMERLKELDIKISGYSFGYKDKTIPCKDLKIDYMIDDYYRIVKQLSKSKIKCLFFNNLHYKYKKNKYIYEVHDWGDILNFFDNLKKSE